MGLSNFSIAFTLASHLQILLPLYHFHSGLRSYAITSSYMYIFNVYI